MEVHPNDGPVLSEKRIEVMLAATACDVRSAAFIVQHFMLRPRRKPGEVLVNSHNSAEPDLTQSGIFTSLFIFHSGASFWSRQCPHHGQTALGAVSTLGVRRPGQVAYAALGLCLGGVAADAAIEAAERREDREGAGGVVGGLLDFVPVGHFRLRLSFQQDPYALL